MATQDPGVREQAALTALPRAEDLPVAPQGYDQARTQEAFEAFRRHVTQLQAQLRVLQAAGGRAEGEASGHAVRMDALHLVRAAAELADTIERDAQEAATVQIGRAESVIGEKRREVTKFENQIEQQNREAEQQRNELLAAARKEATETTATAEREADAKVREAEAAAARLLEQARHQATELTNSARAEIDRSLEWARAEAGAMQQRAREAAEQMLAASGLKAAQLNKVVNAVVGSAEKSGGSGGGSDDSSGT